MLIVEHPIIRGLTLHHVYRAFTSYDPELFIPLTLLSYQINYDIGGLQPFGYHLGNVLLHVGNAVLVGAIAGKLLNGKWNMEHGWNVPYSMIVVLLFALHPLHTEAVVWASARKDVLSAFFFLLSVWMYVRARGRQMAERRWKRWYWWSVGIFALALLSKVSVLTWPLILPLLDWYRGEAWNKGMLRRAAPYCGLSVVFGIVALGGKIANTGFLFEKILIGCRAVTLLLQKFFVPVHLSPLYPFTKPIALSTPELGLSVLFVLFVSVLVVWCASRQHWRLPLFAWGWFLLLLAPSFSNVMKGHNELLDIYVTSDRYAYLPSVGGLLVAGWLIAKFAERFPRMVAVVTSITIISLGALTYRQSLVWKNTLILFTHVSVVQPSAYVAWSNIGTEYVKQGRLDDGLEAYVKALSIRDDATTWYNVGQILRAQGKIDLAMQAYERAVESSPLEEDAAAALRELKIEN